MKNVRCAGDATADAFVWVGYTDPCGWRGERGRTIPEGWWKHPTDRVNYLTRKPCPRCGGRVELIEARP